MPQERALFQRLASWRERDQVAMRRWRPIASRWLGWGSWLGLAAIGVQRAALAAHYGRAPARPTQPLRGISILKPLCGADEGLRDSLEMFARLPYPNFEMLLGVESTNDPAFAVAREIEAAHPHVRVVLRESQPGLNPKVNQLVTLAKNARHDVLLISDANIRPLAGYLHEMSAMFEDPKVGLATNCFSGRGHQTLGATCDNLHAAANSASHVAGKMLLGADFVMGGSEAIRRDVLERLGGFEAYADVLAEDYLLGRDVSRLGYKVATGRLPVFNVAPRRSLGSFGDRFARWGTMQATATATPLPALALALLNPIALAALSWLVAEGEDRGPALRRLGWITAGKIALDLSNAAALGVSPLGLGEALAVPVKDAVLFGSWARGLVNREVNWRGKRARVSGPDTRLSPLAEPSQLAASSTAPPRAVRSHLGSAHREEGRLLRGGDHDLAPARSVRR